MYFSFSFLFQDTLITIYTILTQLAQQLIKVVALFNPKIRLFVDGRKKVFHQLNQEIKPDDKTIWIHCASLGEFEQGLPIIDSLKKNYPSHKIILTFFSPSGYEVKKNSGVTDIITYLPLDTKTNTQQFIKSVHPEFVIFVKYEFWPNYLAELKKQHIDTYLVSGIFRKDQVFFKWFGKPMQKSLETFSHFFVQNETSERLLHSINFKNTTISGDTRFDRVVEILSRDNKLDYIKQFQDDKTTIVYGSSWPDDETVYLDAINMSSKSVKHIIAPHNINKQHIEKLKNNISKPVVLYSEMAGKNLAGYDVFIIDTIGLLTKIYSYADIAFVGGGFKTGLHNTLEPATFGIPIIIGPKFDKFQEVIDLVKLKGLFVVNSKTEYQTITEQLIDSKNLRTATGDINRTYVTKKAGATEKITTYLKSKKYS
jgi:3-deoxy-D-manno-octulosonic-acid transferase